MIINGKVQSSSTCIERLHSLTDVASDKIRFFLLLSPLLCAARLLPLTFSFFTTDGMDVRLGTGVVGSFTTLALRAPFDLEDVHCPLRVPREL